MEVEVKSYELVKEVQFTMKLQTKNTDDINTDMKTDVDIVITT